MSYYRLCPECGAALDPGEVCDCRTSNGFSENQTEAKKAVVNASNTDNGKAGYGMRYQIPASHDNRDRERIQAS